MLEGRCSYFVEEKDSMLRQVVKLQIKNQVLVCHYKGFYFATISEIRNKKSGSSMSQQRGPLS